MDHILRTLSKTSSPFPNQCKSLQLIYIPLLMDHLQSSLYYVEEIFFIPPNYHSYNITSVHEHAMLSTALRMSDRISTIRHHCHQVSYNNEL